MTLQIKNHKLLGVDYIPSPNVSSGYITPKIIVQHYTAGWTDESAIETFKSKASKVSAQLIVGRDGKITQMVPFNRKAWHAGPSSYAGYKNLNSHAIGIENVNIGYIRLIGQDKWLHWNGTSEYSSAQLRERGYDPDYFVAQPHPRVGSGMLYWPSYTEAQIKANDEIVRALQHTYGIKHIVTHEEIDTRGWKTDPGPAFPMERYKQMLSEGEIDQDENYTTKVTTRSLNVRGGPGTNYAVIDKLHRGDCVTVLDRQGDWLYILIDSEKEGWIHGYYTQRPE